MSAPSFTAGYEILKKTVARFWDNDPITLAGATAFYALFSIPPVFIIIISAAGTIAGTDFASGELYSQLTSVWGSRATTMLRNVIENYTIQNQSLAQQLVGILLFLFTAGSFFSVIRDSLNKIWGIGEKSDNLLVQTLKTRVLSIGLIFLLSGMLLLSILLDSLMLVLHDHISLFVPGMTPILFALSGHLLSYFLVAVILVGIFRYLPAAVTRWEVVFVGAFATSLLLSIGKTVIGVLFSLSAPEDAYGVIGPIVLILLWVYYNAIILYFGAELTRQFGLSRGKPIRPAGSAETTPAN